MPCVIVNLAARGLQLWQRYVASVQARDDGDTFFIEV